MTAHIRNLESNYQNVLNEMVYFQRNMAQQDGLMQNLIQYFLQLESGKLKTDMLPGNGADDNNGNGPAFDGNANLGATNPFVPAQEAQRMMGSYPESDVARESLMQMNEISRRAEVAGMSFDPTGTNGTSSTAPVTTMDQPRPNSALSRIMAAGILPTNADVPIRPLSRVDALARMEEQLQRNRSSPSSGNGQIRIAESPFNSDGFFLPNNGENGEIISTPFPSAGLSHEGLQVFTVGHLMPRSAMDDDNGNWSYDDTMEVVNPTTQDPSMAGYSAAGEQTPALPSTAQKLRVRRSTYVPGWSVPPRVLLVEDDAVSRKLSSKFLQIFGCAIDVAVDGVGAVNKMNLERYDLVLMVRAFLHCNIIFLTFDAGHCHA